MQPVWVAGDERAFSRPVQPPDWATHEYIFDPYELSAVALRRDSWWDEAREGLGLAPGALVPQVGSCGAPMYGARLPITPSPRRRAPEQAPEEGIELGCTTWSLPLDLADVLETAGFSGSSAAHKHGSPAPSASRHALVGASGAERPALADAVALAPTWSRGGAVASWLAGCRVAAAAAAAQQCGCAAGSCHLRSAAAAAS